VKLKFEGVENWIWKNSPIKSNLIPSAHCNIFTSLSQRKLQWSLWTTDTELYQM